jgi:hypothetical protein
VLLASNEVRAAFIRHAIFVAAALAASCSLFVSTDGLNGDATDGGSAFDGSVVDAADANVVATDSSNPPNDAGPFSCASISPAPLFCDAFERDTVVGEWTDTTTLGGGALTIDSAISSSGTRSLKCTTPASSSNSTYDAFIHHATFSPTVSDITLAFDENVAAAADQNQWDLFRLTLHTPTDPASGALQMAVTFDSTHVYFDENDYRVVPTKYIGHTYKRAPNYGKWERFSLHLTVGATPHVTVRLGSDVVVDDDLTSPSTVASTLELVLGIYNSFQPAAVRTVNIDDLVLDAK